MCCMLPETAPTEVKAKGAKGEQQRALLALQDKPNQFATGESTSEASSSCCFISVPFSIRTDCNRVQDYGTPFARSHAAASCRA